MICKYENILHFKRIYSVCIDTTRCTFPIRCTRIIFDCLEERKVRDEKHVKNIIQDIKSTFNLNIDEHNFWEVSKRDLEAAHLMYGGKENDSYYNSLTKIYDSGGFSEQPSLFVRAQEAFLLYKEKR